MTDEGIAIEYETFLASEGKPLKECFKCGFTTHRDGCPVCDIEISGDAEVDDVFERLEAGEDINLNEVFKKQNIPDEWEPVITGGGE